MPSQFGGVPVDTPTQGGSQFGGVPVVPTVEEATQHATPAEPNAAMQQGIDDGEEANPEPRPLAPGAGMNWGRIGHGMNPGAYPQVRDYISQALEDPTHPEHARAIQELNANPLLAGTVGLQITPEAAQKYGIPATDSAGLPIGPGGTLTTAPQPPNPQIQLPQPEPQLTLNRVTRDLQGNIVRTPIEQTPSGQAALAKVQTGLQPESAPSLSDLAGDFLQWGNPLKAIPDAVSKILGTPTQSGSFNPKDLQLEDWMVGPFALQRGAIEAATSVATPGAAALAVATGGLGELGVLGKVAQAGITGYFATKGAESTWAAGKAGAEKAQQGDWEGALHDWGMAGTEGLFTALMARASARGMQLSANWIADAYNSWRSAQPKPAPGAPDTGPSGISLSDAGFVQDANGDWRLPPGAAPGAPRGAPRGETLPPEASFTWTDSSGRVHEATGPAPPQMTGGAPADATPLLDAILDETNRSLLDRIVRDLSDDWEHPAGETRIADGPEPAPGAPNTGPSGISLSDAGFVQDRISLSDAGFVQDANGDWRLPPGAAPGAPRGETPPPASQTPAPPSQFGGVPVDTAAEPPTEATPTDTHLTDLDQRIGLLDRQLSFTMHPEDRLRLLTEKYDLEAQRRDHIYGQLNNAPVTPAPEAAPTPSPEPPSPQPQAAARPHVSEPSLPPDTPSGDTTTVKTARATTARVQYAWIPRSAVAASNDTSGNPNPDYPQELQPRDRTRQASGAQIAQIAGALDPEQLGANPMADRGAPIVARVNGQWAVVSGNGRKIAFDSLAGQQHPNWDAYQQYWADHAHEVGIDPDDILNNPDGMLARVIVPGKGFDLAKFAAESNEDDKAAMSAAETAKADAQRIAPLMGMFQPGEDGDVLASGNRDFVRAFMQEMVAPAERGRLMTRDGEISQAGVSRIRNAIFAHAYGADTTALEKLAESPNSNIRNVTNGMMQAAGAMAQVRSGAQSGNLLPVDLGPDVSAAAGKLAALRESGTTIPDYLKQQQIFGPDLSQEAKVILGLFHRYRNAPRKLGDILKAYAEAVEAAGNPQQQGMFGNQAPPTKGELLDAAITKAERTFGAAQVPGVEIPAAQPAAGSGPAPVPNGTAQQTPAQGQVGEPHGPSGNLEPPQAAPVPGTQGSAGYQPSVPAGNRPGVLPGSAQPGAGTPAGGQPAGGGLPGPGAVNPGTEDVVTANIDKPLTPKGEADARKLALNTHEATSIDTSPMARAVDTARQIADQADQHPEPAANPALAPWNLGEFAGRRQSEVKDQIDYYISHPDEVVPGGESFNTFRERFVRGMQHQLSIWTPGDHQINVTHSIGVHVLQAWIANGAPEDGSISVQAMLHRQHMGPTSMFRIDPQEIPLRMRPVNNASKDGVFIIRHADTAWDNLPVSPSAQPGAGSVPPTVQPGASQPQGAPPTVAPPAPPLPSTQKYEHASTQFDLPEKLAKAVVNFGKTIPAKKLAPEAAGDYGGGSAATGLETNPHITARFGLDVDDPDALRRLLAGQPPITVTLGKASLFHIEGADVLKVDVESPELHKLNELLGQLPNTNSFPAYVPHVTVAYLKPGEGAQYDGKALPGITKQTVTFTSLTFSDRDGNEVEIPLTGKSSTIYITGATFEYKNEIRRLNARWNDGMKAWELPDTPENRRAVERISKRLDVQPPFLPEGAHVLYADVKPGDLVEDKYGFQYRVTGSMRGAGGDVYLDGVPANAPEGTRPSNIEKGYGSSDRWYGIQKVGAPAPVQAPATPSPKATQAKILARLEGPEFADVLMLESIGGNAGAGSAGVNAYADRATGDIIQFGNVQDLRPEVTQNPSLTHVTFRVRPEIRPGDPPTQITELFDQYNGLSPQARQNIDAAVAEYNKRQSAAQPWRAWKPGQKVTFRGTGGRVMTGVFADPAVQHHGAGFGGMLAHIVADKGNKIVLVPVDQITHVAAEQSKPPVSNTQKPPASEPLPSTPLTIVRKADRAPRIGDRVVVSGVGQGTGNGGAGFGKVTGLNNQGVYRIMLDDGREVTAPATNVHLGKQLPPSSPQPSAPTETIPPSVLARVKSAIDSLNKIADALKNARQTDAQFHGEGRYEWETWQSIRDRDKQMADAEQTLAKFRQVAAEKGIDPEATISELGGIRDYHPTEAARTWGGNAPAPKPVEAALTPNEERFIEAAYTHLEEPDGFKNNADLANLANQVFGGERHAGAWNIKQVYDLLEAAVAKHIENYQRRHQDNPEMAMRLARDLVDKLPRQTDRTAGQEAFQQFSTPPTLGLLAAVAAHLKPGDTMLEPSAGTAMLASWAKAEGVAHIDTNEIDPEGVRSSDTSDTHLPRMTRSRSTT